MKRFAAVAALVLSGALGLGTHGAAHASGGGNSDAAHACQDGGYATLRGTDGTTFKNTGECVSYAAHGGQFAHAQITASYLNVYGSWCSTTVVLITGSGFAPNSPLSISGAPAGAGFVTSQNAGCLNPPAAVSDAGGNVYAYAYLDYWEIGGGCTAFTDTVTVSDAAGNSASTTISYDGNIACI